MALDIGKFLTRFVEEAREHVARLGEGLDAMARDGSDMENINSVFRSAHTIKGSSRMLKLGAITETAHKLEDVLSALRDGSLSYSPDLGGVLYRGVDAIAALVERVAESKDPGGLPPPDEALCAALAAAARGAEATPPLPPPTAPAGPSHDTRRREANPVSPPAAPEKAKTPDTVRVNLAKLDELIKLMGEVVSSHATLRQRLLDIRAIERAACGEDREQHTERLRHFVQTLRDDVQGQELLMDELHDKALIMRMLPLAMIFDSAGRTLRELAHSVGKEVECVVAGSEIELDRQMIDKLANPIVHLLRNAVDHGLEAPDARRAAGKPAQGRVGLSARQDGGSVVIEVADDGAGIALDKVREKAVRKGFLDAEKAAQLTDQEAVELIFLPGFSTSQIITDISGRGVGMDVVKQSIVDDLRGVVSIETRTGAGTTFSLRLPLSLAVMRVLLVSVQGMPFGFTAQYVAELIRVPRGEILTAAERDAVIVRDEFIPVVALTDLLDLPAALRERGQTRPPNGALGLLLVVVRVRDKKLALAVDELLDERDMVIKPLPEHMRHLPMVSGVVATGRNELVSVLHAPALMDAARRARGEVAAQEQAGSQAERQSYRVLVVDDSLNTREIEKDVLEAWGYRVTLAENGLDGLQKARAENFDAVLTDVEMPHMDGFTFTARLREEAAYRNTPIVIITSREKEEDKRRGIQVGADAYIVKGEFEQSSLVDTLRSLLGACRT